MADPHAPPVADSAAWKLLRSVSETALLTLYYRACETGSKNPIIRDAKAVEMVNVMSSDYDFSRFRKNPKFGYSALTISMRARRIDRYVTEFVGRFPDALIINLGCGFDTRFSRVDNGRLQWVDLDLPEVIELRRHFFPENERFHMIASSVIDYDWMPKVPRKNHDVLVIAEGLLEYLSGEEVRALVMKLLDRWPGCELVCEVVHRRWSDLMRKNGWYARRFRQGNHLDEGVVFRWGIQKSDELEGWNPSITFLDDWTFFDDHEKKLGWIGIFGAFEFFRKAQWLVHYRLGAERKTDGAD